MELVVQIFTMNLRWGTGFWDNPNTDLALKKNIKQAITYAMESNKLGVHLCCDLGT